MHPLHPLSHVLLAGACHYVAPAPKIWRPVPASGRYGTGNNHMFPSIPCPIFWQGGSQLLSFCLCILPNHPAHWEHNRREVISSRKASLKIYSLFFAHVEIGFCVCISHHSIMRLCQNCKHQIQTSYEGGRSLALLYTHGGVYKLGFKWSRFKLSSKSADSQEKEEKYVCVCSIYLIHFILFSAPHCITISLSPLP